MNHIRISKFIVLFILFILLTLVLPAVSPLSNASALAPNAEPQDFDLPDTPIFESGIVINEVMLNPDAGEFEWVELKNSGPSAEYNPGFGLTDEDGNWYRLPQALSWIPAGAFILIIFNGEGSVLDDLDFSDNVATLNSQPGLVDILENDADQVSLYTHVWNNVIFLPNIGTAGSSTSQSSSYGFPILSYVAWGNLPTNDGNLAILQGLWPPEEFIEIQQAPGNIGLAQAGTLGRVNKSSTNSPADWDLFPADSGSPGGENGLPAPHIFTPVNGTQICSDELVFGWSGKGTGNYHLEVDNDSDFSSPLVSVDTDQAEYSIPNIASGKYYYHVKAAGIGGVESGYSAVSNVTVTSCTPPSVQPGAPAEVVLSVDGMLQHKDTRMLNLDWDTEYGLGRWDSAHESDGDWNVGNGVPVRAGRIDDSYCVRASIAMIVSYYGGDLSQDRISYEQFGSFGVAPQGDLGAGHTMWPNEQSTQGSGRNIFDWAMDAPVYSSRGKPSYYQVVNWINHGQPLLLSENDTHAVLAIGHASLSGIESVLRLDPMTLSRAWVAWSSWNITEYHVPPASATPRSDEDTDGDSVPDTLQDSDNDGMTDFDEMIRFDLDPNDRDSDEDGILDKLDLREYVFNNAGEYDPRNGDMDQDGSRKEKDIDNDGDGAFDGCEDANKNGVYEHGLNESNNFDPFGFRLCGMVPGYLSIPAGPFQMGIGPGTSIRGPMHTVYLDSYQIMRHEVTNWQYMQCVIQQGCSGLMYGYSYSRNSYYGNPNYVDYPVLWNTWYMANQYCAWAGGRLPTEAEWEKAARGASDTRDYPWGNQDIDCTRANYDLSCLGDTAMVGSYPAGSSPYGAMDMIGNVWEWVNDWYQWDYYAISPSYNPPGPATGNYKVIRGSSYLGNVPSSYVYDRMYRAPDFLSDIGFRCMKSP
jgi:formylglycine-generating enzyme required for sulfatase activity